MGCVSCAGAVLGESALTLRRLDRDPTPVGAESISPDRIAGLSRAAIAALPATRGKDEVTLGELFEIDGANPFSVTVTGDLRAVHGIGSGMTMGEIVVDGDVGDRVGARMRGGALVVRGNAGDWAGAALAGGRLVVEGRAGDHLGAAQSGDQDVMDGGTIVVRGDVGRRAGDRMKDGLIVVLGDAGEEIGASMTGGFVVVAGRIGAGAGLGMVHGTIAVLGEAGALPGAFRPVATSASLFPDHVLRELRTWGLMAEGESVAAATR